MANYQLKSANPQNLQQESGTAHGLGIAVLIYNARWFVKVRWIVVAFLAATGLAASLAPGLFSAVGFNAPEAWPLSLCGILAAANVFFWLSSRKLNEDDPITVIERNIWMQIALDLLVLTALVHYVGSTSTFVAFTYLFHVVLACVFFSPSRSLLVTLTASLLYMTCVGLELWGVLPVSGVMPINHGWHLSKALSLVFAVSAVAVWFIVWYLVASLSRIVAERTFQLEAANRRLRLADEEKNQIVLRTTHDLKAPFSGIESNIEILKIQHWDDLSDKAKEILLRIEVRAQTLSERIRDILVLGSIRSEKTPENAPADVNLEELFKKVHAELEDKARSRSVKVLLDLSPAVVKGDPRRLSILFANLLSNAIVYSRDGGTVNVSIKQTSVQVTVTIKDSGIGISEKDLPHIFEEYYRSRRAAEYNSKSTGLGLAIVKEIARKEAMDINVTSEEGHGTTFEIVIHKNN